MAQEWYLLSRPHNQLSGYEDEALTDFAEEGFLEALDSEIAVDVELVNYDMSESVAIRAVVQNNVQDTKLKSLNRHMLVPIGTCKAGMYVKYKNRFWLIIGIVDDNGMYEKAVMIICNHLLTWVNKEGKVVQRWANVSSASQYNNGETTTLNYFVRTDQLMILTPDDDESLMLESGIRFIIDKRCKIYEKRFTENVLKDTSNSVIVYRLTRADSVLYDYQDSGHFEFLAYQDEQRESDGYYVIDGKGYWICGNAKEADKPKVLKSEIECSSPTIYTDNIPQTFTARFYDENGDEVVIVPQWKIECDFSDELSIKYDGNSISISTNKSALVNKSFMLSLSGDGYETVSISVLIRAFI